MPAPISGTNHPGIDDGLIKRRGWRALHSLLFGPSSARNALGFPAAPASEAMVFAPYLGPKIHHRRAAEPVMLHRGRTCRRMVRYCSAL
ncbi:hypothetical protein BKA80DRAFT_274568 [Phyllosticta citrichinensis]